MLWWKAKRKTAIDKFIWLKTVQILFFPISLQVLLHYDKHFYPFIVSKGYFYDSFMAVIVNMFN